MTELRSERHNWSATFELEKNSISKAQEAHAMMYDRDVSFGQRKDEG